MMMMMMLPSSGPPSLSSLSRFKIGENLPWSRSFSVANSFAKPNRCSFCFWQSSFVATTWEVPTLVGGSMALHRQAGEMLHCSALQNSFLRITRLWLVQTMNAGQNLNSDQNAVRKHVVTLKHRCICFRFMLEVFRFFAFFIKCYHKAEVFNTVMGRKSSRT